MSEDEEKYGLMDWIGSAIGTVGEEGVMEGAVHGTRRSTLHGTRRSAPSEVDARPPSGP